LSDAETLNERGLELSALGDSEGAIAAYRRALELAPEWSLPWYNLGLVHKYRREWKLSAECNLEATRLDPTDEAGWWNLGIASTALGDWARAREAWRKVGISVPGGEGPITMNYGLTPIRLDPGGRGEVVWCDRIDPARAIIRNIPFTESGRHYGDVLLHDGAPNGFRLFGGREVPVFDALECLLPSDFSTFILDVPGSRLSERKALSDVAFELGGAAEDWSESVRFICRRCSEGRPHEQHDSELSGERPQLAVAAAARSSADLDRLILEWRERTGYDGYVGIVPGLDGT
jgi:hypothetical protein